MRTRHAYLLGASAIMLGGLFAATATPIRSAAANQIEGFTQPYEAVRLATAESGIIRSLHVREGDRIQRGQLVASLKNGVLKAALATARARAASQGSRKAAESSLRQRESRLTHIQRLRDSGHASLEELERAEVDRDIAAANLIAAQEKRQENRLAVEQIAAQLARREIRSPIDGVITELRKRPGELVNATDSHIATVVGLDRLRVTFYLPTPQASELHLDEPVTVIVKSSLQTIQARTEFISPITDSDSDTVRVEVIIDNVDGQYRSGVRCLLADVDTVSTKLTTSAPMRRGRVSPVNPLRRPSRARSTTIPYPYPYLARKAGK